MRKFFKKVVDLCKFDHLGICTNADGQADAKGLAGASRLGRDREGDGGTPEQPQLLLINDRLMNAPD